MARPRTVSPHLPPRPSSGGAIPMRDADGRPYLRLQTLGAATILIGERRLSAGAGTLFTLLLRVAYAPGMLATRDALLASLWPDLSAERQRANLRQALYKLRGHDVRIALQGDVVLLDPTQVMRTFSLDRSIENFERDVTLGMEPFGVFLPGLATPWPEYQDWVQQQREAVHADIRRVLVHQLKSRRERADWGGADALARWLLQFDPLNEEATLTVAECAAMSGSKTEGIAIIDRYLAEIGPEAGDLRLQATMLRRRITEMGARTRGLVSPTERYFVGREQELADLTMSMRRARWHDGSAVLLYGPPGIGKSRLLRELEKVAAIDGVRVVHTACRESEVNRPLTVFLDLLPQIIALPGAIGCAPESLSALRRLLPREIAGLTSQLAEAAAANAAAADATSAVSTTVSLPSSGSGDAPTAASLRRAILDVIASVSDERPLLIAVEDIHWIDEQSWDALSGLIERIEAMRVFVVLNSRTRHARPAPPERAPARLVSRELHPLSDIKALELSHAIADDLAATLTSELGEWFTHASEGVPLFLHALVVHWVETGEAGGVPPTLRSVIEQRLSRLDGTSLRVLQAATLLGRWATVERVQEVLELRTNEMIGCLEQVEALCVQSTEGGKLIRPHELVASAAQTGISQLSRTSLHARIAASLYSVGADTRDPGATIEALEHYNLAGDNREFFSRTIGARDLLLEAAIPQNGLDVIQRLAKSHVASPLPAELERCVLRLHLLAGEYGRAFAEPIARLRLPTPKELTSEASVEEAILVADAAIRADPHADREQIADLFLAVVERPDLSRPIRLRAAEAALMAYSNDADFVRADRVFASMQFSDNEIFADWELRRIAILYHAIFGDRLVARRIALDLLEHARGSSASASSHQEAMRAAQALRIVGDDRRHIEGFELAYDHAIAARMPRNALNVAIHLTHSLIEEGDQARQEIWKERVVELFRGDGDPFSNSHVAAILCRLAIEKRDAVAAAENLDIFLQQSPRNGSRKHAAFATAITLHTAMITSSKSLDSSMVEVLLARRERVAAIGTCDYMTSVAVLALCRLGEPSRAQDLVDGYLRRDRRETREVGATLQRAIETLKNTH